MAAQRRVRRHLRRRVNAYRRSGLSSFFHFARSPLDGQSLPVLCRVLATKLAGTSSLVGSRAYIRTARGRVTYTNTEKMHWQTNRSTLMYVTYRHFRNRLVAVAYLGRRVRRPSNHQHHTFRRGEPWQYTLAASNLTVSHCLIVHSNCHGRVVRTSRHYSGSISWLEPSLSLGKQINKNNIGIMHLHTP